MRKLIILALILTGCASNSRVFMDRGQAERYKASLEQRGYTKVKLKDNNDDMYWVKYRK